MNYKKEINYKQESVKTWNEWNNRRKTLYKNSEKHFRVIDILMIVQLHEG